MTHNMIITIATLALVANMAARIPSATAKLVESITALVRATTRLRQEIHRLKSTKRRPEKRQSDSLKR